MRAAYVTAVQAGASEAYRVERSGAVWRAPNPAQRLTTDFSAAGVRIEPQGDAAWSLSLQLDQVGCEGALSPVDAAEPEVVGNRVEYSHASKGAGGGLVAWYVNGQLGLEQGFTLEAAPP